MTTKPTEAEKLIEQKIRENPFTWEDVDRLREHGDDEAGAWYIDSEFMHDLADRIATLLERTR